MPVAISDIVVARYLNPGRARHVQFKKMWMASWITSNAASVTGVSAGTALAAGSFQSFSSTMGVVPTAPRATQVFSLDMLPAADIAAMSGLFRYFKVKKLKYTWSFMNQSIQEVATAAPAIGTIGYTSVPRVWARYAYENDLIGLATPLSYFQDLRDVKTAQIHPGERFTYTLYPKNLSTLGVSAASSISYPAGHRWLDFDTTGITVQHFGLHWLVSNVPIYTEFVLECEATIVCKDDR